MAARRARLRGRSHALNLSGLHALHVLACMRATNAGERAPTEEPRVYSLFEFLRGK